MESVRISALTSSWKIIYLKTHIFEDHRSRFDFLETGVKETSFINFESIDRTQRDRGDSLSLLNVRFLMDSKLVIHTRKTYGILEFLGDLGGVYESLFLFGSFLHLIISQDALSIKLLEDHFKIEQELPQQQSRLTRQAIKSKPIISSRRVKFRCKENLFYGTCLRILFIAVDKKCKRCKKHEKLSLLNKARKASKSVLDLRTMFKVQSVAIALSRAVFTNPSLIRLALLQKHGRVLKASSNQVNS